MPITKICVFLGFNMSRTGSVEATSKVVGVGNGDAVAGIGVKTGV
jgi:hypothetical protein